MTYGDSNRDLCQSIDGQFLRSRKFTRLQDIHVSEVFEVRTAHPAGITR